MVHLTLGVRGCMLGLSWPTMKGLRAWWELHHQLVHPVPPPRPMEQLTLALGEVLVVADRTEVLEHEDSDGNHREAHYKHHHPHGRAVGFWGPRQEAQRPGSHPIPTIPRYNNWRHTEQRPGSPGGEAKGP